MIKGVIKGVHWEEIHYDRFYNIDELIEWLKQNLKPDENPFDLLYANFPNLTPSDAKDAVKGLER